MINLLICLIISVLSALGMAIALVEKGDTYPIRKPKIILKLFLRKYISKDFSRVVNCTTCTSMWTTLFSDIFVGLFSLILFDNFYFLWPLSGFITLSFAWFIIEFLNAIDRNE